MPFTPVRGPLYLNALTASDGWVRLEMTDVFGKPLAGFELERCAPLSGDHLRQAVRWVEADTINLPVGEAVRLRLRAKRARVYSIASAEPEEVGTDYRFSAARP
jgi:hypothetical protein